MCDFHLSMLFEIKRLPYLILYSPGAVGKYETLTVPSLLSMQLMSALLGPSTAKASPPAPAPRLGRCKKMKCNFNSQSCFIIMFVSKIIFSENCLISCKMNEKCNIKNQVLLFIENVIGKSCSPKSIDTYSYSTSFEIS